MRRAHDIKKAGKSDAATVYRSLSLDVFCSAARQIAVSLALGMVSIAASAQQSSEGQGAGAAGSDSEPSTAQTATNQPAQNSDRPRFEAEGFLRSFDAFISESAEQRTQAGNAGRKGDYGLSLRSQKKSQDSGFLYLNDAPGSSAEKGAIPSGLGILQPDFLTLSSQLDRAGLARTERSSRLGLQLGGSDGGLLRGLELALTTSVTTERAAFADLGVADFSNLTDIFSQGQSVGLGLSLGYYGFNLDAGLARTDSLIRNSRAVNVGLSYADQGFSARLAFVDYSRGDELFDIAQDDRDLRSVELGASLQLSQAFGLSGGLRYLDYGNRWLLPSADAETSQMVFFGGQLLF